MRKLNMKTEKAKGGNDLVKAFSHQTPTKVNQRDIPVTELRCFYKILETFRLETQLNILKDFNRKNKFEALCLLYNESKMHFSKYDNSDESFLGNHGGRKELPPIPEIITSTTHAAALFEREDIVTIDNNKLFNFKYIEREVSTLRTTKSVFDSGKSGSRSGMGGLDFIGINSTDGLPILGEVKIASDKNTFYALIQLLTYLSEIVTQNQIKRINNTKLFGKGIEFHENTKFYLYIMLTDLKGEHEKIFLETVKLAKNLKNRIFEIQDIVFLKLDKKDKTIHQIN